MESKNFDVTIVNATRDGKYFNFTFKFEDGKIQTYNLSALNDIKYPQIGVCYSNLVEPNRETIMTFKANLPTGYRTVNDLWDETQFKGLKGILTIQKN